MKRHLLLTIFLVLGIRCADDSGTCKEPESACNNCIRIYDAQGNYINGGSIGSDGTPTYWNGTDCNGDSVPCGKYRVEMVYQGRSLTSEVAVSRPDAIVKYERSACDSLKKACGGFYYEEENTLGLTCVCCQ